jgi:hypothetical protein
MLLAMGVRRVPRPSFHLYTEGSYRARVRQVGAPDEPVSVTYWRFLGGAADALGWRATTENTVVLSVPGTDAAENLRAGQSLAQATLRRLAAGEVLAVERPYQAPPSPNLVAEIDHPRHWLRARILKWPDAYEIRTIGYVPNGFTLPAVSPSVAFDPDYDWGILDLMDRLLADTEEEARAAAVEELERLANSDLPVLDR